MATITMTNATLTIGDCTCPVNHAEIRITRNAMEEDGKRDDRQDAMTYAAQPLGRRSIERSVDLGRVMVSSPLLTLISALCPSPGKMRRDLYLAGMIWADPDGRWRMDGYDEDLTWFRDLLAFRYGDAVGPIVPVPHPHFQLDLLQMYACRDLLRTDASDPWAETDEACIRRWARLLENSPEVQPKNPI